MGDETATNKIDNYHESKFETTPLVATSIHAVNSRYEVAKENAGWDLRLTR